MSKASAKIILALLAGLAAPTASFARAAGQEETVNLSISGSPQGPANAGGSNTVMADPSGIGNASRIAPRRRRASPSRQFRRFK
jgi:hypothetical protein